jgi:hypothetical protein
MATSKTKAVEKSKGMVSLPLFTASIVLAMVFTLSCSGGDDDGGGGGVPFNENSQIYTILGNAYNGNGTIKIVLGDTYTDNHIIINAGSVTNGVVKLELPQTIPDEYLSKYISNIHEDDYTTRCTDYPEDIKVVDFGMDMREYFVLIDNNGAYIGELIIAYFPNGLVTETEGINYLYSAKAGRITCNYKRIEGSLASTINVNIDAKAGWNKIYLHYDWDSRYPGGVSKVEVGTDVNILTKEVKWFLQTHN